MGSEEFLAWHKLRPGTPGSEIVSLHPNRRDCSGGSDDHARRDDLKLGAPVKQDGPVYGKVEPLSDRQRPVGSEAETGAAHVDSATGPGFSRNTMA